MFNPQGQSMGDALRLFTQRKQWNFSSFSLPLPCLTLLLFPQASQPGHCAPHSAPVLQEPVRVGLPLANWPWARGQVTDVP